MLSFTSNLIENNKEIASEVIIGKTISKKNIPAIVITQQINKRKDNRKAVIIMARQHPG